MSQRPPDLSKKVEKLFQKACDDMDMTLVDAYVIVAQVVRPHEDGGWAREIRQLTSPGSWWGLDKAMLEETLKLYDDPVIMVRADEDD